MELTIWPKLIFCWVNGHSTDSTYYFIGLNELQQRYGKKNLDSGSWRQGIGTEFMNEKEYNEGGFTEALNKFDFVKMHLASSR